MSKIEILSGLINGVSQGGGDYKSPIFENGDFHTPDPRNWVKQWSRLPSDGPMESKSIIAMRIESTGTLFLIYSQNPNIGTREGDGAFCYTFFPNDLKVPSSKIGELLNNFAECLNRDGYIPDDVKRRYIYASWSSNIFPLTIPPCAHGDGPCAFINYSKTHGKTIESVLDVRFQKIFTNYVWIVLSDHDASDEIRVKPVDDLTDKIQQYFLWDPRTVKKAGNWTPTLMEGGTDIYQTKYIYKEVNNSFQIRWETNDDTLKYGGIETITFEELFQHREDLSKFLKQEKILQKYDIPLTRPIRDSLKLKYHAEGRKLDVTNRNGKLYVYLNSNQFDHASIDNVVLAEELKNFYEIKKMQNKIEIVEIPKETTIIIKDGNDIICKFVDTGNCYYDNSLLKNVSLHEENNPLSRQRRQENVFQIKPKITIPVFVAALVGALLLGLAGGYLAKTIMGSKEIKNQDSRIENPDFQINDSPKEGLDVEGDKTEEETNVLDNDLNVDPEINKNQDRKKESTNTDRVHQEYPKAVPDTKPKQEVQCTLRVKVNESSMGSVNQSTFTGKKGDEVIIKAVASEGCKFDHWSDNNKENPRNYKLKDENATIKAIFVII